MAFSLQALETVCGKFPSTVSGQYWALDNAQMTTEMINYVFHKLKKKIHNNSAVLLKTQGTGSSRVKHQLLGWIPSSATSTYSLCDLGGSKSLNFLIPVSTSVKWD